MKEKQEKKNIISVNQKVKKIFNKEIVMFVKSKNAWVSFKIITSLDQKNVI